MPDSRPASEAQVKQPYRRPRLDTFGNINVLTRSSAHGTYADGKPKGKSGMVFRSG